MSHILNVTESIISEFLIQHSSSSALILFINKHLLSTYNVQCIVVVRDLAVHKTEDNPCALTELRSIKVIQFSL